MKQTRVRLLFILGCMLGMTGFSLVAQAQVVVNMTVNAISFQFSRKYFSFILLCPYPEQPENPGLNFH